MSPECWFCGKTADLVAADGPKVVCRECVAWFTELAFDPSAYSEQLIRFWKLHGDVVRLTRETPASQRFAWAWTERWPAGAR